MSGPPHSPRQSVTRGANRSVFTKIFILLILVSGLGTTLCNWNLHSNESSWLLMPVGFSMSEGRISELEEFLNIITKMMQVQLELVDIKIGKQLESLRKELLDKIEEQMAAFFTELRNLQTHTGEIEESKREGFVNSVVDGWAVEGKGQALSLDDMRTVAKQIVEAEIEKYSADGLRKVDYALGSGGGKVFRHSEGYFVGTGKNWGLNSLVFRLRRSFSSVHPDAYKILQPSFGEPGQCLPLKGNNVFVEIALRTSVLPEAVTLEHVAKSVSYDRSSAPKDFRIFGWLREYKDNVIVQSEQMFLGEFSYDLEKGSAQTFNLRVESTGKLINMIKLDILSNHGNPSFTCIYRLRVHGSMDQNSTTIQITNES